MDDFERLTSASTAKSCISPQSANKNILSPWDTSRCRREAWEDLLKCYNFVTVDSSLQNASITIPLRESAVGFDTPVSIGAQSPESYSGDFFCARLVWLLYVAGRMGAPSGAPGPIGWCVNPVRSVSSLDTGDGGKQMPNRSSAMLKLFRGMLVPCFSVRCPFLGHSLVNRLSNGGEQ